jgi:hypothetical protein
VEPGSLWQQEESEEVVSLARLCLGLGGCLLALEEVPQEEGSLLHWLLLLLELRAAASEA